MEAHCLDCTRTFWSIGDDMKTVDMVTIVCLLWAPMGCSQVFGEDPDCVEYGELYNAKFVPTPECCSGLVAQTPFEQLTPPDGEEGFGFTRDCRALHTLGTLVCTACGDGVCDPAIENRCNCEEDCGP